MKRILALWLALVLALTGCAAMLERSYQSVQPHVEQDPAEGDPSILRAENYQSLVSAVLHFVSEGRSDGKIRLYKYTGDVEADLSSACEEVRTEDPLGAYALDGIDYECSRIVSYYECTLTFRYRRSRAQRESIQQVSGLSSIRDAVRTAMEDCQTELVLRLSSYYADPESLQDLARQAYRELGLNALGRPEMAVALYPENGVQKIAELTFDYGVSRAAMMRRQDLVDQAAGELLDSLTGGDEAVAWTLAQAIHCGEAGEASAYAALVSGEANHLGAAMTYQGLCQLAGIPCQIVSGTREGKGRYWNIVELGGVFRHVDVYAQLPEEEFLRTDSQMEEYNWDTGAYPACAD
ncbi:MAG: hypothetical protein HFF18_08905 [Oscillospiraceae bacterium]|nr:hypothetical protein [Oscillospiraceae bacterium]